MKTLTLTIALLLTSAASQLSAQTMAWPFGSQATMAPPAAFTIPDWGHPNFRTNFGSGGFGTAGFTNPGFGMAQAFPPSGAWQMPEFPKFPEFPGNTSWGQGFASSSSQQSQYSSDSRGLSATYQNAEAAEVVAQLAGLAGIDPPVSDQALKVLEKGSPITRSFTRVAPRAALETVLKDLELRLDDQLGILTQEEWACTRGLKVSERTIRSIGIERQLSSPRPLMAFRTPLGLFLQSVSMQLGVEVQADWKKLQIDPYTPVTIEPFTSTTMGDSLKAGLASAGLDYRLEKGQLMIGRLAD